VTLRVQVRLLELVMTDRATVPMNPFVGLMVMVDVPATPALRVRVEGLALMLKSAAVTPNTILTEWDKVPLVPVTVAR